MRKGGHFSAIVGFGMGAQVTEARSLGTKGEQEGRIFCLVATDNRTGKKIRKSHLGREKDNG